MMQPTAWFERNAFRQLKVLGDDLRLIFCCYYCELVIANYDEFARRTKWPGRHHLRDTLDLLWSSLQNDSSNGALQRVRRAVEAAIPDPDDSQHELTPVAQDVGVALLYATDYAIAHNTKDLKYFLQVLHRILDGSVSEMVADFSEVRVADPATQRVVDAHPQMQRAMEKQENLLRELRGIKALSASDVERFRARATAEAAGANEWILVRHSQKRRAKPRSKGRG